MVGIVTEDQDVMVEIDSNSKKSLWPKAFALGFFLSLNSIASTDLCLSHQFLIDDLETTLFNTYLESNPGCYKAIKELKINPIENENHFAKIVSEEKSSIIKDFDHRNIKSYDAITDRIDYYTSEYRYRSNMGSYEARIFSLESLEASCDKLKHCIVSCKLSYSCGIYGSRAIGRLKEIFHDLILRKGEFDTGDLEANEVGLLIAENNASNTQSTSEMYKACESKCVSNILRLHVYYYDYPKALYCR